MIENAKWIWLNKTDYPKIQTTVNWFAKDYREYSCRFADFQKGFAFDKKIDKIIVEVSADVKYFLYVNGKYVGIGPVTSGGDYNSALPMPQQYYDTFEVKIDDTSFDIFAQVQTLPIVQCDMTQGRNGFILACEIVFADGERIGAGTDRTWFCRLNTARTAHSVEDGTQAADSWKNAEEISSAWNLLPSEIPNLVEDEVLPQGDREIAVKAQEIKIIHYELDKIYAGYYVFSVQADGLYEIDIYDYEKDAESRERRFTVKGEKSGRFRSVVLTSVGAFDVAVKNLGGNELKITDIALRFQHYPCLSLGDFRCSDGQLNKIYDMGKHALKICRQSVELDSPKHQENLQCAGDYHIASLMNYYADGDTELTRFDIMRIARYLEMSDGYMFHTTYGLIWVQMIYEYYMHSGDTEILYFVKPALEKLLNHHVATTNEIGLIDKPLNYMFVDWLDVDDYTMHHPPKALGQTVLNAFYYQALKKAATMYEVIGEKDLQELYEQRAKKLKAAFAIFFDEKRGLYFDGLNDDDEVNEWMPKNTDKRYYSWHSNALAVLYDLAPLDKQRSIMEKVLNDETLISPQPYFMHFVLEAIGKVGLFEKYGMQQLDRWKYMTDFGKGLVEGWMDCEAYGYDYSHVWAGTPTYQLPQKLLGLKILEAGFEKISLKPQLFGLEWANIQVPTPKGVIKVAMKKGEKAKVSVPNGIIYILEE